MKTYYQIRRLGFPVLVLEEMENGRVVNRFVKDDAGFTQFPTVAMMLEAIQKRGRRSFLASDLSLFKIEETTTTTEGREERTVISEQEARVDNSGNVMWAVEMSPRGGDFIENPLENGCHVLDRALLSGSVLEASALISKYIRVWTPAIANQFHVVPVRVRRIPGTSSTDIKVTELK